MTTTSKEHKKYLIIICGPTGVGKTDLSIDIAEHFRSEIISCDSRQIYKELNKGVAKPNEKQLTRIKHHFVGTVSIEQHYSIYQYETDVLNLLDNYYKNNNIAVMCGGSGLYIDAVCNGVDEMPDHDEEIRARVINIYINQGISALRFELQKIDPLYYSQVDLRNPNRIMRAIEIYYQTGKAFSEFRKNESKKRDFEIIKIGINLDRDKLYERINKRVDEMILSGLLEEVKSLVDYKNLTSLRTIGYSELFMVLNNEIKLQDAIELIKRNTRHYARRQITWFKRYNDVVWFTPEQKNEIIVYVNDLVNNIK
ncbi:MAG TPA: tRNA (adenosine(37)-N6)-dimethylallyltransferase MiaA [Bacteroidales bacterium]|nr:tRNA (adenosine(37)-N6)-dimethylallyltransferase MiaA [Bacteroidales bacterium]